MFAIAGADTLFVAATDSLADIVGHSFAVAAVDSFAVAPVGSFAVTAVDSFAVAPVGSLAVADVDGFSVAAVGSFAVAAVDNFAVAAVGNFDAAAVDSISVGDDFAVVVLSPVPQAYSGGGRCQSTWKCMSWSCVETQVFLLNVFRHSFDKKGSRISECGGRLHILTVVRQLQFY